MTERPNLDFTLDKVVHEQARLAVLTYLASSAYPAVPFTELRERLELSAGNLSVQLRNLEDAGYVHIDKRIADRKPVTTVSLTPLGYDALKEYIAKMEGIIRALKSRGEQKE